MASADHDRRGRSGTVWVLLGLILTAGLLYGNTLTHELVWDDRELIEHHPALGDLRDLPSIFVRPYWDDADYLYRPLTVASFAVNTSLNRVLGLPRTHTAGFHLVNLLLHALVGALLFRLARSFRFSTFPALTAALLFVAHPLRSEAVASVVGRAEILAALFGLLFLLLHRARRAAPLAGLALLLALWSKESAVAFVPLALVSDLLFRDTMPRVRWSPLGAYVAILAGWFAVRHVAVGANPRGIPFLDNPMVEASLVQRLLTACSVQFEYLRLQCLTVAQSSDYSYDQIPLVSNLFDMQVLTFLVVLTGSIVIAWRTKDSHPTLTFAVAGYAILFAPTSNFLFPIGTIMGERLSYAPSLMFCLLAALLVRQARRVPQRYLVVATIAIALILGWRTVARNRVWSDELRFAETQLLTAPNSAKAHYNLAVVHHRAGRSDEAKADLARAVEILPAYAEAWNRLGRIRIGTGELRDAVVALEKSVSIFPGYAEAWTSLGEARAQLGLSAAAIEAYSRSIEIRPTSTAFLGLGVVQHRAGRYAEAIRFYEQALQLDPDGFQLHNNLGSAFAMLGRYDDAERHWRRSLALRPGHPTALENLQKLDRIGQAPSR